MVAQPRILCKLTCHDGFLRIHPTCVPLQRTRLSIHLRAPFTLKIGASVLPLCESAAMGAVAL
jgi:hypothetical protein